MNAWTTAALKDVCSLVTDGTHHSPANLPSGEYRYVTAKNIRPWGLDLTDMTYVDAQTHREIYARCPVEFEDVLYIKDGVTTGIAVLNTLREPFSMLSSVALLKPCRELLVPRYLKHWLNSPVAFTSMTAGMTGTAIKRLVLRQIRASVMPIAPLAEQQRIADKLDTVLARVDACRNRLTRITPLLKRFRQSVLVAATSGLLTEDLTPEERAWTTVTLDSLCSSVSDGPFGSHLKSDDYVERGARVVRLENIGHLTFNGLKQTFISLEKYSNLERYKLAEGDLLFSSFVDEEVRVCRFPGDLGFPAINKADCFRLRVNPTACDPSFLMYRLACKTTYSSLKEQVHGATRPRINLGQLRRFELNLPSREEQTEIVRRVETLLAFADRLEARLSQARSIVDRLAPSLLAKAFRGELVPQDPADAPATDLLKRLSSNATDKPAAERPCRRAAAAST